MNNNKKKVRKMTTTAMLGAITVLLGLTPLGFIPIGPLSLTTMHIPVIIAGILEGPVVGAIVGLVFGLTSLGLAITRPAPTSFVFYNPLISFLPRILIGVVAAYSYKALKDKKDKPIKVISIIIVLGLIGFLSKAFYTGIKENAPTYTKVFDVIFIALAVWLLIFFAKKDEGYATIIPSFLGAMVNTILVLGFIYLFYADRYVSQLGIAAEAAKSTIFGVIITNGIPEAMMASVIVSPIIKAVQKRYKSNND